MRCTGKSNKRNHSQLQAKLVKATRAACKLPCFDSSSTKGVENATAASTAVAGCPVTYAVEDEVKIEADQVLRESHEVSRRVSS